MSEIVASIVILTYNRIELLDKLLESLCEVDRQDIEIIIVDNHSEDATEKILCEKYPQCIVIRTERNLGVCARNLGIKRAKGEIIICLDDDVFGINQKSINSLVCLFTSEPSLGAVNFKVIDYFSGQVCNWVHHCTMEDHENKRFTTYEITEGAVAFNQKALLSTSLYPDYFFISHEGPDLAFQIMNNGYSVIYNAEVVVKHYHSDLGRKSWTTYYYDTRNQYWLAARNFPFVHALRYLFRGQVSTLIYALRDGFFKYWIKGVYHGLRGLPRALQDRKVVTRNTFHVIKNIDRGRPSHWYLIKRRIFRKGMRL